VLIVNKAELLMDSVPVWASCLFIDSNVNLAPDIGLKKDNGYYGYICANIPTVGRTQSLLQF
jgi:hypothetical protein